MSKPVTDLELMFISTLSAMIGMAVETEIAHGFDNDFPTNIALVHSELSEALEEFRAGHKPNESYRRVSDLKPEGVPSELADVVIRIMGMAAKFDIQLGAAIVQKMRFNKTRPYLHGGKVI